MEQIIELIEKYKDKASEHIRSLSSDIVYDVVLIDYTSFTNKDERKYLITAFDKTNNKFKYYRFNTIHGYGEVKAIYKGEL